MVSDGEDEMTILHKDIYKCEGCNRIFTSIMDYFDHHEVCKHC